MTTTEKSESQAESLDPADHTEWVRAFTRKFSKQFNIGDEEFEELVGMAFLGLVEAAERFDPSKGVPFRAYAQIRVRGSLLDGLSKLGGLSRTAYAKARAYRALTDYQEHEEIERRSNGSPEEKLAQVFQQAAQAAFVHRLSYTAEDGEELLADEGATPEEITQQKEMNQLLTNAVSKLPEKERLVIEEYYLKHKTFDEIGAEYEMSKGWISKVHKKALANLQSELVHVKDS